MPKPEPEVSHTLASRIQTEPMAGPGSPAKIEPSKGQLHSGAAGEKKFPGEAAENFENLLTRLGPRGKLSGLLPKLALFAFQPLLGSLSDEEKKWFEKAGDDRRFFSVEAATGLNIVTNLLMYPALFGIIGALGFGKNVFSPELRFFLFFGLLAAAAEAVFRAREALLFAKPMRETKVRSSLYGFFLSSFLKLVLPSATRVMRQVPVPVDGFYSMGFDAKRERERRYGTAYTLEDLGSAYLLRFEFPRLTPAARLKDEMGLGNEMPDYDFNLSLVDGSFVIKGRCLDERVRKLSIQLASFPLDFTTRIQTTSGIHGFQHRYRSKLLEVLLLKS
jgi:hypothetical protein